MMPVDRKSITKVHIYIQAGRDGLVVIVVIVVAGCIKSMGSSDVSVEGADQRRDLSSVWYICGRLSMHEAWTELKQDSTTMLQ